MFKEMLLKYDNYSVFIVTDYEKLWFKKFLLVEART